MDLLLSSLFYAASTYLGEGPYLLSSGLLSIIDQMKITIAITKLTTGIINSQIIQPLRPVSCKKLQQCLRSIVQNQCRLRTDRRTAAKDFFGRILIDFAVLAHYGVHGLGDINRY